MSNVPGDLRFTESHEWVQLQEDGTVMVGITDYAQTSLGELVYVELPDAGDVIDANDDCAVIESVKAASDIYCPLTGQVEEVNAELENNPGLVNESPYDKGWLFKLTPDRQEDVKKLMDAEAYRKVVAEEAH